MLEHVLLGLADAERETGTGWHLCALSRVPGRNRRDRGRFSDQDGAMSTKPLQLAALAALSLCGAGCATPRSDRSADTTLPVAIDLESTDLEGVAHGFPVLRNLEGERLADGEFTQSLEGDRLHVKIRYVFSPSRSVEERSVIRQEPTLVQELWSWVEMRDGEVYRKFEVDFLSGTATAEKREKNKLRRWSTHVDVEPGRAFAGASWALAIKGLRERLLHGETIELQTVGFTPKPKAATVEISHVGVDQLPMSGRTLVGDRFLIHPKIPWIVRLFVHVPDSQIWLANPPPAAFLRFEGPLAEPGDSLVRVDLLPGDPSGVASPANP